MQLHTQEHYDLMEQFERQHKRKPSDREDKESWSKGFLYKSGHLNDLFKSFRDGYALGICVERSKHS